MKKLSLVLALAVSLFFVQSAAATPLVVNGGFETGDFTGWTLSYPSWATVDNAGYYPPNSGLYSGTFGAIDYQTPNILSQNLATVAGTYSVSFWLANDGTTPINNKFDADLDGTHLLTLLNAGPFAWTQYTFTATVSGPSTLTFTFFQLPAFFHLDDVSVSAVPLPGSLVLLASALLPLGWRRLRKG